MARMVTAPVAAGSYKRLSNPLTHAVEIAEDGTVLRVLCYSVKPTSILEDWTQYTTLAPTCPGCAKRWATRKALAATDE